VHGLGGSDQSSYVVSAGHLAFGLGWHVLRMNMRGAGDSLNLCPRLYNAGLDSDLLAVLRTAAHEASGVAALGFSLGGSLVLLTLARQRLPKGFIGAVAISPPLDLGACADAVARPANRLYEFHFMRDLRRGYRERQWRRPDLYEARRERGTRSLRDYDERITAPYGGYRGADDYYSRSSAGPVLTSIDQPTLILAAADDPMVPSETVAGWALPSSGRVRREILPSGGHSGFVSQTRAQGHFWAAERAAGFLMNVLRDTVRSSAETPRHPGTRTL
jgi:predicted alpha/beta-fold hydrolase